LIVPADVASLGLGGLMLIVMMIKLIKARRAVGRTEVRFSNNFDGVIEIVNVDGRSPTPSSRKADEDSLYEDWLDGEHEKPAKAKKNAGVFLLVRIMLAFVIVM
jgi:hypothetical protein